ncbi:MAG: hydroxymethylbilane synthase, partial [Microbacterium sp.]|nr:hydroxymethylbilane synthase [Microbacterium sp.]
MADGLPVRPQSRLVPPPRGGAAADARRARPQGGGVHGRHGQHGCELRPRRLRVDPADGGRGPHRARRHDARPPLHGGTPSRPRRGAVLHRPPHRAPRDPRSPAVSAPLRLGTRRSALALAQSQRVADALAASSGRPVELVPITSEGDVSRASLSELGGRGVFATRLREALLAGECDLLVHSLKDLPTADAPGLVIAATPAREDARDIVVTRDGTPLHDLAPGALVGTGSPRRVAQVLRHNPRVRVQDLRGNVDSRLARVRDGELDAVVLAAAGLVRLGGDLDGLFGEPVGLREWPTAPGQGALAVETRADAAPELRDALAALEDDATRIAVT